MKLIIFTGPPASGKSSLSSDIAKDLKIDCISKDLFKMHLFDKYGFKNHDEKKLLSIKGEAMMYRVIKFYIKGKRHLGLSTTNYFPYTTGISNLHKPITEADVSNIQKNVLENSVGDNVLHLNTNHIESDYINLCNQVKKFIRKGESDLIEL